MTNEMISISTSQTFHSWVVIFHLHQPMAFLSLNPYDTPLACSSYECFILRARRLSSKLLKQGYLVERLKSSFRKFYGRYGDLIQQYEVSLTNVKWHSDPWPTVTTEPIRLSTNLMTLIPTLTFIELRVVSMEHLQWVWHASRERLPFWTTSFVAHFGTCLCSNCWDQIPRTCHVFTRLFHLEYPLVLSQFCSVQTWYLAW